MASMSRAHLKWALAVAVVLPVGGCVAAAAAAGAGAGIYLTSQGAESLVKSSVADVASRAQAIMKAEGIVEDASSSRVEVTARKNLAEWDKDYAQQLLSRIVQKS